MAGSDTPSGSNENTGGQSQPSQHDAWIDAVLQLCSIDPNQAEDDDTAQVEAEPENLETADGLIQAVDKAFDNFGNLTSKADQIVNREELRIFENLEQKANDYLLAADDAAKSGNLEDARDNLENGRIAVDGMQTALDRGISTASKLEGHMQAVADLLKQATAFYKKRKKIEYEQQLSDLLSYQSIVETLAQDANAFLGESRVNDAISAIDQMRTAVANMEKCFDEPKNAKKAKKASADDVEYGMVSKAAHAVKDVDFLDDVFAEEAALHERSDQVFALTQKVEAEGAQDKTGWDKKKAAEFEEARILALNVLAGAENIITRLWLDSDVKKALPKIDSSIETAREAHTRMKKIALAAEGHNEAEAAEILEAEQDTDGDVTAQRMARLSDDVTKLATALNTANANWRPVCEGINNPEFMQVFKDAIQTIGTAEKCAGAEREDTEAQCTELKDHVSAIKASLNQLHDLYNTAKSKRATQLGNLERDAKAVSAKVDKMQQRRAEIVGWDVDLSAFDQAAALAEKARPRVNLALADKSGPRASAELDQMSKHANALQSAFDHAKGQVQAVEADVSFRLKNLKSAASSYAGHSRRVIKKANALAKFNREVEKAASLLAGEQAVLDARKKAEAYNLIGEVEQALSSMETMLGFSSADGKEGADKYVSARREELLQALREKEAELQQLESWADRNEDVDQDLIAYEDILDTAQSQADIFNVGLIELGNLKPNVIEGTLKAVDAALEQMQNLFLDAKDKMEKAEGAERIEAELNPKPDLMERIRAYEPVIAEYAGNTGRFVDLGEKNFYKGLIENLRSCLRDASAFYHKDDDAKGEELLDNKVDVYFDSLDDALAQADVTKKELAGFQQVIDTASQALAALNDRYDALKTQAQRNTFMVNSKEVTDLIASFKRQVGLEDIKPIRDIIPQLKAAVQKIEEGFPKTVKEKARAAFGRKKKGTFEDELAEMKARQQAHEAEQAALKELETSDEHLSEEEKQAKARKKEIFQLENQAYKACEVLVLLKDKAKKVKGSNQIGQFNAKFYPLKEEFEATVLQLGEYIRAGQLEEARAAISTMKAAEKKLRDALPKTTGEKLKAAFGKKKQSSTDTPAKKGKRS